MAGCFIGLKNLMQQSCKIPISFLQIIRVLITGAPSVLASSPNYWY